MIALGLSNILLTLLIPDFTGSARLDWIIFGLIAAGSILLISTGFWYAHAGPSFRWKARRTVLAIALWAIISGLGIEVYKALSTKRLKIPVSQTD